MNPFLSELYNTAENIGQTKEASADENEKLAQAHILDQMLQNEGMSIDQLTPQDIVKVATEIFGPDSPLVKEAEMPPQLAGAKGDDSGKCEKCGKDPCECPAAKDKEAQEKLAEADFLGRAMAHAYVDELRGIEKAAAEEAQKQASAQRGVPTNLSSLLNKQASAGGQSTSALDVLAQQRAQEILKEAGVQQQPNDAQEKLAQAVNARAIEMLKAAGYTVE